MIDEIPNAALCCSSFLEKESVFRTSLEIRWRKVLHKLGHAASLRSLAFGA